MRCASSVSIILFCAISLLGACGNDDDDEPTPAPGGGPAALTDLDGNSYPVVQIGDQYWMGTNLRTTRYCDGTSIPQITGNTEWTLASGGAWCHYENDASHDATYGKLYNWLVMDGPCSVCPTGWHVPNDSDWTELTDFLGGGGVAGGKLKSTGTEYWQSPNTGATNSSGFAALPGGLRVTDAGASTDMGTDAYFWSTSSINPGNGRYYKLTHWQSGSTRSDAEKRYGFSVRCIRD